MFPRDCGGRPRTPSSNRFFANASTKLLIHEQVRFYERRGYELQGKGVMRVDGEDQLMAFMKRPARAVKLGES